MSHAIRQLAGRHPDLGDSALVIAATAELGLDAPGPDGELFAVTAAYLEQLSRAQLLRVAASCGVPEADPGMKKAELVDTILLAPDRDPAWWPPELTFAPKAEILAALAPAAARPDAAE